MKIITDYITKVEIFDNNYGDIVDFRKYFQKKCFN